ncbi:MAG: MucR family transcriptional regulator, partial [Alphaproteobacteria bacterium]
AYVSNNNVPVSELPNVIASVHAALAGLGKEVAAEPAAPEKATAAQIKKSVTPHALISFVDGKSYKTLRRHLTMRGLTPEDYRAKYGLPADYPMTSATYSAQRSELARSLGLGQLRRKAAPEVANTAETISEAPKRRGRKATAADAPETTPKARGPKKVAETA